MIVSFLLVPASQCTFYTTCMDEWCCINVTGSNNRSLAAFASKVETEMNDLEATLKTTPEFSDLNLKAHLGYDKDALMEKQSSKQSKIEELRAHRVLLKYLRDAHLEDDNDGVKRIRAKAQTMPQGLKKLACALRDYKSF